MSQGPPHPCSGLAFRWPSALLRRRDDNLVLVREERDGHELWSVPAARVERGELVTEALIGGVAEQTGLTLTSVGRLAYVVNTTSGRYPSVMASAFECASWDEELTVQDPDSKVTHVVMLSTEDAKKMLRDSAASRSEIKPLLAYPHGARHRRFGGVWSYCGPVQ